MEKQTEIKTLGEFIETLSVKYKGIRTFLQLYDPSTEIQKFITDIRKEKDEIDKIITELGGTITIIKYNDKIDGKTSNRTLKALKKKYERRLKILEDTLIKIRKYCKHRYVNHALGHYWFDKCDYCGHEIDYH